MPDTLNAGDRVSEYVLEACIGRGTFGEVWRARHHVFDERVAIKVPTDPDYIKNLQSEGLIQHDVISDHIVRTKGLDPWHDPPYMVMEYVEGASLREVLKGKSGDSMRNLRGPAHFGNRYAVPRFSVVAAVDYARQILDALNAAHSAGVVHRDLKPENVLVTTEGTIKVMDFGLGRVQEVTTTSIMMSGSLQSVSGKSISGTLEYMSPEQRTGGDVDARTDIYALGVIFFEMLTGERPGGSELPSEVNSSVPPALDEFYRRCYARLENRYQSAGEALEALEAATREPEETVEVTPVDAPVAAEGKSGDSMRNVRGPAHFGNRYAVPRFSSTGPTTCSACHSEVDPADFFCIHCGAQLRSDLKQCPSCGGFPQEGDQYCIFCGQQLTTA